MDGHELSKKIEATVRIYLLKRKRGPKMRIKDTIDYV